MTLSDKANAVAAAKAALNDTLTALITKETPDAEALAEGEAVLIASTNEVIGCRPSGKFSCFKLVATAAAPATPTPTPTPATPPVPAPAAQ